MNEPFETVESEDDTILKNERSKNFTKFKKIKNSSKDDFR